MNNQVEKCSKCDSDTAKYLYRGEAYCRECALALIAELKKRYLAGEKTLGWEIEDLWQQGLWNQALHDDLYPAGPDSWLEEEEFEAGNEEYKTWRNISGIREDARELVNDFIDKYLAGDLMKLKNFDFRELADDTHFGCQDKQYFDCDNTSLSQAIYALVWQDVFPYLELCNIGYNKAYRGDTMNTFHTVFGRVNENDSSRYDGLDKFAPIDDAVYDRVRLFHREIHTIGNYVVLPNYCMRIAGEKITINKYRGCHEKWHDYFDQFLMGLEACMTGAQAQDETLRELIAERNDWQMEQYQGQEGFTELARRLFLDDYLTSDGHARNLFADADGRVRFHWEDPRPTREVYLDGALNYLKQAESIIDRRADRILNCLAARL